MAKKANTIRLRFVRDAHPYEVPEGTKAYKEGDIVWVEPETARRWLRRGAAVEYDPESLAESEGEDSTIFGASDSEGASGQESE